MPTNQSRPEKGRGRKNKGKKESSVAGNRTPICSDLELKTSDASRYTTTDVADRFLSLVLYERLEVN